MRRVKLPWPPPILSPNSRANWQKKYRAAKEYRNVCFWLARHAGIRRMSCKRVNVEIVLCQPNGRVVRDDDNAIGAFKAGRDGIAQAIGVDDGRWNTTYPPGDPCKDGAVSVTIWGADGDSLIATTGVAA